jgi:predicted kinase
MELIISIGLPGSGKSTYYRTALAKSHTQISKDLMSGSPTRKNQIQIDMITQSLTKGLNAVIDNTSVTAEVRRPLIELGHKLGAKVIAYYFPTSVKDCIARNAQRTGRAKVPNVAIYTMAKKLQGPTKAEGFDDIITIN